MQIVRKSRIPGRENPSRTFEGLSDFANLFTMFLISTFAIFVLYVVFLLIVNLVAPETVSRIDWKMTDAAVNSLMANRNYESAIALMELNTEYVEDESSPNDIKLGECYENVGEYGQALRYYLRNWNRLHSSDVLNSFDKVEASEKVFGLTEYLSARVICRTYQQIGDMKRATEFLEEMKRSYSDSILVLPNSLHKYLGPDSDWMSMIQNSPLKDQAVICYRDDPSGSIEMMRAVVDSMLDEENINVNTKLGCLNQLIGWEIEQGRSLSAISDIHIAVSVARKACVADDFKGFAELAGFCKWAGENDTYEELMPLYRRYLRHKNRMKKPEAIQYVRYLVSKGRLFDAERRLVAICNDVRSRIESNLLLMSDEQREYYVATIEEPFSYAEELLVEHPSPGIAELVASNMLFKKGLLLRSNRNQRLAIEAMNDPHLIKIYDELISTKRELVAIKAINSPDQIIRMASLQKQIYTLDKSLSESCYEYLGEETLKSAFSIETLQDALGGKDSFTYFAQTGTDNLFAIQIRRKGDVKYYRLGNKSDIDENIYRSPDLLYGTSEAYEKLLSPVPLTSKGMGIAYYSTSGIFNQISFSAFRMPDGKNLMDVVKMKMVSDPSSLTQITGRNFIYSSISLWGGIRYSDIPADAEHIRHRGIKRGEHLVYLKGSLDEVERISSIMSSTTDQCNVYTSYDATEASFKNRDGQRDNIVHISTHGFFNEDSAHFDEYDMMTNSGLFFAGADKYWASDTLEVVIPYDGNDGILRSSEIELMNLNGCHLVVLSACETGLGFDDSSEGVYGLQRAFKLAGADKVMMSLWEVPDVETSLLMETFYVNLQSGDEINEALRKAQSLVRKIFPSPESWGGFVILN